MRELLAMAGDASSRHSLASTFDAWLESGAIEAKMLVAYEADLACLDPPAWQDLKTDAVQRLIQTERREGSYLFDLLNEAKSYRFLKELGCVDIRFLRPTYATKSPDLAAILNGKTVLCEVKTIVVSGRSRILRRRGGRLKHPPLRPEEFVTGKLRRIHDEAKAQLDAYAGEEARKIICLCFHFEDSVDDIADYRAHIDEFLARTSANGIEVFAFPRCDATTH